MYRAEEVRGHNKFAAKRSCVCWVHWDRRPVRRLDRISERKKKREEMFTAICSD